MLKRITDKTIFPLMKKSFEPEAHVIFEASVFTDEKMDIEHYPEHTNTIIPGVWPLELNLIIEVARYENNILYVTVTNLFVEPIRITSMGVKNTSLDRENIDFRDTNISLPPGESVVQIPCPNGCPFKFVIRTANLTGIGCSKDNINW